MQIEGFRHINRSAADRALLRLQSANSASFRATNEVYLSFSSATNGFYTNVVLFSTTSLRQTNSIGAFTAYAHGMGTVVRCGHCDTALIRVAHVMGRYWMDMRGMGVLQIGGER